MIRYARTRMFALTQTKTRINKEYEIVLLLSFNFLIVSSFSHVSKAL